MKKTAVFATIAIAAVSGIFAQPKKAPLPPDVELPKEAVVKEYHNAQINAFKALKDAQVKAGICNQERADAAVAILKAAQSECKGQCIVQKRTDIPFGGIRPRSQMNNNPKNKMRNCPKDGHSHKQGFDMPRHKGKPNARPPMPPQPRNEPPAQPKKGDLAK